MHRSGTRVNAFWQAYSRSRYAVLFYALLVTLLVIPLSMAFGMSARYLKIAVAGCLFAAVMPNATRKTQSALFAALVLLIGAPLAAEFGGLPINRALVTAALGLGGLAAAAGTVRFMVSRRKVDSETIYAALSTYLLAGIFFGQLYWAIERLWPGSIVGPDPLTEQSAIYYSFVTLATLGYGDFLPRSELARGIATFQVIGGQLYLAVMVARLIGLFDPARPDR
jgi:hypothetical protein